MHTVNSNKEVKPDSLWRALELLLYIPLDKSWGAQLLSWWKKKIDKYEWCKRWIASAMKVRTHVQAIELEWEQEKKQSQTQEICFEIRAQISTSLPSPREGFSLSAKKTFTKKLEGLYKIRNTQLQPSISTQEVAQRQWSSQVIGSHKDHKPSPFTTS